MICTADWKKILRHPLFGGCDRARLMRIAEECGCEVRSFAGGEVILSPESDLRAAGLLLDGKASVTITLDISGMEGPLAGLMEALTATPGAENPRLVAVE